MKGSMPWVLVLVLAACPKKAATPDVPVELDVVPVDETRFLEMPSHFHRIEEVRALLIRGKLDDAKQVAARVVVDTQDAPGPPDWKVYVDAVRAEAEVIVAAQLFADAALALGRTGEACGACHAFAERGPEYLESMAPLPGKQVTDRMASHIWGADRLWQGLVGPSPDVWTQGAEALSQAPLWRTGDVAGEELPKAVRDFETRVREHAAEALDAPPRAETFAGVIATCAGCHSVARP